jgi:hypothetical protein
MPCAWLHGRGSSTGEVGGMSGGQGSFAAWCWRACFLAGCLGQQVLREDAEFSRGRPQVDDGTGEQHGIIPEGSQADVAAVVQQPADLAGFMVMIDMKRGMVPLAPGLQLADVALVAPVTDHLFKLPSSKTILPGKMVIISPAGICLFPISDAGFNFFGVICPVSILIMPQFNAANPAFGAGWVPDDGNRLPASPAESGARFLVNVSDVVLGDQAAKTAPVDDFASFIACFDADGYRAADRADSRSQFFVNAAEPVAFRASSVSVAADIPHWRALVVAKPGIGPGGDRRGITAPAMAETIRDGAVLAARAIAHARSIADGSTCIDRTDSPRCKRTYLTEQRLEKVR